MVDENSERIVLEDVGKTIVSKLKFTWQEDKSRTFSNSFLHNIICSIVNK